MQRGLTLPELMIGLLIFAVIVSLAGPSFDSMLRKQEVKSQVGILTSSLALARNEAISRGQIGMVCASDDGASCDNVSDWSSGWLVFIDEDEDGEPDAREILRAVGEAGGESTLNVNAVEGGPMRARYNEFGERLPGVARLVLQERNAEEDLLNRTRTILINPVGSVSVRKGVADLPDND